MKKQPINIDAQKFLHNFNIPYTTSGTKHCRSGWIQIGCPFCAGGIGTHLGIKLPGIYASCWRCKGKSVPQVIQALLMCSWTQAYTIIQQYSINAGARQQNIAAKKVKLLNKDVKLPSGTINLLDKHDNYLIERKFNPEYLEKIFGLQGTGPIGEYKHRIIAPILWQERLISYQGRDVTGKSELKYKACAEINEAYPHKHSLYGIDLAKRESVLVVEGITDVWRLGPGAIATFGTSFTSSQVKMIHEGFKRAFILFDTEPTAQKIAHELGYMLAALGMKVEILTLDEGDPGDMKQCDANALMKELE